MNKINVIQIIDTLTTGGAERAAVNIANSLPSDKYCSVLCTTRNNGPLANFISNHVIRLSLERKNRFDLIAFEKLVSFINNQQIHIIHAHSTSLFIGALAAALPPFPNLIWHDHYGLGNLEHRPYIFEKLTAGKVAAIISVNHELSIWAQEKIGVVPSRIYYIPNFVPEQKNNFDLPVLPGYDGFRIVCVANFRPQKDHFTLLNAMREVIKYFPEAHLLLVGDTSDKEYVDQVKALLANHRLNKHISILGQRLDIPEILQQCDLGILSSNSEGLPISLLEYGQASLPVVVTNVGQCAEVVDHGKAGKLVPPGKPQALANAIISYLSDQKSMLEYGRLLNYRVAAHYGQNIVMSQIEKVYAETLNS